MVVLQCHSLAVGFPQGPSPTPVTLYPWGPLLLSPYGTQWINVSDLSLSCSPCVRVCYLHSVHTCLFHVHRCVHVSGKKICLAYKLGKTKKNKKKNLSVKTECPLGERRRKGLDCTFTDENFMTLNLDRLLVSVRITAAV